MDNSQIPPSTSSGERKLRYEPLQKDELRLLTVHPTFFGPKNDVIQCSLDHFSLEDLNEAFESTGGSRYSWGNYIALSYCWGWDADDPSRHILINNHAVRVTESLEAALQCIQISQTSHTSKPMKYWIDALCINQADEQERAREIMRMRDIYGQSLNVFVHLGPASGDSVLGCEFLRRTAADLEAGVDCASGLLALRFNTKQEDRDVFRAAVNVLCRPYWYRVWILQELGMSNGEITVGCGLESVKFEDIVSVARLLILNQENLTLITGYTGLETHFTRLMTSLWVAMWAVEEKRRRQQSQPDTNEVTYLDLRMPLLTLAQNALATKAHDKIYGILGLMPDAIRKKMEAYVDYSLPTDTVFATFSRAVIEVTGDLDIICAKNFEQSMKPTWATDWTVLFDRAGFPHDWLLYGYDQFDGAYDDLPDVIESSRRYRADGGRKSTVKPFSGSDALALKCEGFKIGTVDGTAPFVPGNGDNVDLTKTTLSQSTNSNNPYGDSEATRRALIHTLFGNSVWGDTDGAALFHIPWLLNEGAPMFNADGSLFIDDQVRTVVREIEKTDWKVILSNNFFVFEWWRRHIGDFTLGGTRFMDYFDKEVAQCQFSEQRIRLDIATALGAHVGRRLVTLQSGHFGLAPRTARAGDEVFVLLGCSVPVILRPVENTDFFEVVGECYVEGYADGEAVMGLDRGAFQLRELSLC
ncbi:HET-domain-containing protein [Massarina eburnea CBS 473.64]|uniref:HET-domain-containing protein n=1 Tax=Massarina eburnea CBS 473.64 TaxID=1395130 RepID=A0A6A6SFB1_9PLEO|nr:HET-domain-containing protein [Massarina eburnea CBS 473.64]